MYHSLKQHFFNLIRMYFLTNVCFKNLFLLFILFLKTCHLYITDPTIVMVVGSLVGTPTYDFSIRQQHVYMAVISIT